LLFEGCREGAEEERAWYGDSCALSSQEQFATCPKAEKVVILPDSGIGIARLGKAQLLFLAIPNGLAGKGSHTHNDKLSIILRLNGQELFCDSGTGCYTRFSETRNRFRSTDAHTTAQVSNAEQNTIPNGGNGLFCLGNEASVSPIGVRENRVDVEMFAQHRGYLLKGVLHKRRVQLSNTQLILHDEFQGAGPELVTLFFQVPPPWHVEVVQAPVDGGHVRLNGPQEIRILWTTKTPGRLMTEAVEISKCFGVTKPATRIRAEFLLDLPSSIQTEINL
jgi:hypothetical protein